MATQGIKSLVPGRALSGSALACVIALGACTFNPTGASISGDGSPDPTDALVTDGILPPDALPPDASPCWTWTPAHFDSCMLPPPDGPLTIGETHFYNTDDRTFTSGTAADPPSMVLMQPDGTEAAVISVTDLNITAGTLFAEGSRPLIIAASGTVTIAGRVDVASYRGLTPGAGFNHSQCPAAGPGGNDEGGAGGGGAGGFQGKGGDGAAGDSNDNNDDGMPSGGAGSAAVAVPATVRGGCPGGAGGSGSSGTAPAGGNGGGAVQITAQTSISVLGSIVAGGSGGPAGTLSQNGGAGGGSGGYIGLDAPVVMLQATAVLAANGGGGGEGATTDRDGDFGNDGAASSAPAPGGSVGTQFGGNGGAGSAGTDLDGVTATDIKESGGGGGGGGAGYIIVRTASLTNASLVVSPPAIEQTANP